MVQPRQGWPGLQVNLRFLADETRVHSTQHKNKVFDHATRKLTYKLTDMFLPMLVHALHGCQLISLYLAKTESLANLL